MNARQFQVSEVSKIEPVPANNALMALETNVVPKFFVDQTLGEKCVTCWSKAKLYCTKGDCNKAYCERHAEFLNGDAVICLECKKNGVILKLEQNKLNQSNEKESPDFVESSPNYSIMVIVGIIVLILIMGVVMGIYTANVEKGD